MEQLDTETVRKFVNVVQVTNTAAIPNFKYHKDELLKLHVEAKDNCRFLTTLERHFKVLRKIGMFQSLIPEGFWLIPEWSPGRM